MVIKYFQKPFFLAAVICCFIFYCGIVTIPQRKPLTSLLKTSEITEISGQILNSPVKINSGKYYSALFQVSEVSNKQLQKSSATGNIKIYIPTEMTEAFFPGRLYSGSISKGSYFYESGGFYHFQGKFSQNGFYVLKCTDNYWINSIYGKIDFFRALCRLQFKRLMYAWGTAGGLLLALLSGAKEYTDPAVAESFRNSGLSHILALSGMHLSMFSSIAIFFGNKIGQKRITFIIRIFALVIFVWFAGLSPSLLRAFICSCLTLFALSAGAKEPDMILILSFSFLLQSIISPDDIQNPGFMLSYGALAGILLTNKFFYNLYSKTLPAYFSASLGSSTGAQIFTIPIALKFFKGFAPIGIVATSIISPLITIFIYSGLLLIVLCLIFPVLQTPSGIFINLQYTVIKFCVNIFSKFPKITI